MPDLGRGPCIRGIGILPPAALLGTVTSSAPTLAPVVVPVTRTHRQGMGGTTPDKARLGLLQWFHAHWDAFVAPGARVRA